MNKVEQWKAEKHGFDIWPNLTEYAARGTPMKDIDDPELERMKWYGVFYRKRDGAGTYMLRIRLTGCEMTAPQAKEIAYIAYQYGYGIVDVTTRANVQVQGLKIDNVPKALARLEAVGLTAKQTGHDNIRNVFGHPLAGVDFEEIIDTRPLCREITTLFIDSRIYSDLPRKMNIAMNGRPQHGSHFWSQDISYLACRDAEGAPAFQVLLAGTQGQNPRLAWHLPVLVRPEQVVQVTGAILDLFREQGSREKRDAARLRYLVEKIGIAGVLGELEKRLDFPLQPCIQPPQPPTGYEELIGWFKQPQGNLWALGLSVPLGRLSWQQLESLAILSKRWGSGNLRATHEQGLMIVDIPSGFKDAAATAAAGAGLSPHADSLARNTVACTGKQFCNIAVTETKGHMFQLIEKLRQRALKLHGIRIHMSGCPSSCAQQHTADIGLKGVRVRRLLGTTEGFDVALGGGIAGQIHLALPYKMGVDVNQLPVLIEEVVKQYYLKHRPGQTFSAYWREEIQNSEAAKVVDRDYSPPTWLCESCNYRHLGEDPPVYCPLCAGLRRNFARIETDADEPLPAGAAAPAMPVAELPRADGFLFAALESAVEEKQGLQVELAGKEIALFRVNGKVVAMDNACPHEGAPLSQGSVENGVVTCPWHGWTFNACTGCSLDPPKNDVKSYETKLENGRVFLKLAEPAPASTAMPAANGNSAANGNGHAKPSKPTSVAAILAAASAWKPRPKLPTPVEATLTVLEVIEETPDVRTFRFDNTAGKIPAHLPGQFAKLQVTIDGKPCFRSFTISSCPSQPQRIDLTIKRNPAGQISNHLFENIAPGSQLTLKSPQGAFFYDPKLHPEPLLLVSAGSGITPMMCIVRSLQAARRALPVTFVHGARTQADIIFAEECQALATQRPGFDYLVALSQPDDAWTGWRGRISFELLHEAVPNLAAVRVFLCGPGEFMDALRQELHAAGVPADRIHTEQFHKTAPRPLAVT